MPPGYFSPKPPQALRSFRRALGTPPAGKQTHQTLFLGENGSVGDQGPRDPSRNSKEAQTCSNPNRPRAYKEEEKGDSSTPRGSPGNPEACDNRPEKGIRNPEVSEPSDHPNHYPSRKMPEVLPPIALPSPSLQVESPTSGDSTVNPETL